MAPYRDDLPLPDPETHDERITALERKVRFAQRVIFAIGAAALTAVGGGVMAVYRAGASTGAAEAKAKALEYRLDKMDEEHVHLRGLVEWYLRRGSVDPRSTGDEP